MKKIFLLVFIGVCFFSKTGFAAFFEYELYVQAESSLDQGWTTIRGKIVNTGDVAIKQVWGAIWGIPSGDWQPHEDENLFHLGSLLAGETYFFSWLYGEQSSDLSANAGSHLWRAVGFVPVGSDWRWDHGGCIEELAVASLWVNGPTNTSLPWNKTTINLATAGEYLSTPTPIAPVPEPSTMILVMLGFFGLVLSKVPKRQ